MPSALSISSILLQGDEALLTDLLYHSHNEVADTHVPIGGDRDDLGDFGDDRCGFGVSGGALQHS